MSTGAPEEQVSDRVLTVPNALSAARLVGVPVFLWAILTEHDALALVLLFLDGLTDYLDTGRIDGEEPRRSAVTTFHRAFREHLGA